MKCPGLALAADIGHFTENIKLLAVAERNSEMFYLLKKNFRGSLSLLLLALCLSGCAAQKTETAVSEPPTIEAQTQAAPEAKVTESIESEGFESPEEALAAYLTGLKEMNFSKMMGSFAVESYVKNTDFQAYVERYGAYSPNMAIKYPSVNPLLESINIEGRRSSISEAIARQYWVLGYSDFDEEPKFQLDEVYRMGDWDTAGAFVGEFSDFLGGTAPDSLELLGFIPPEKLSDVYSGKQNLGNIEKKAVSYGVDKMESCAAVFEIRGDKWLLCADVANYGDRWYIVELQGNIGKLLSIPATFSGVMPILDWDSEWESKMVPVT